MDTLPGHPEMPAFPPNLLPCPPNCRGAALQGRGATPRPSPLPGPGTQRRRSSAHTLPPLPDSQLGRLLPRRSSFPPSGRCGAGRAAGPPLRGSGRARHLRAPVSARAGGGAPCAGGAGPRVASGSRGEAALPAGRAGCREILAPRSAAWEAGRGGEQQPQ